MHIGISTSVIQRGRTGVAQYLFALLRAYQPFARDHHFSLFVLEEDLPLFADFKSTMRIIPVPEHFRPPLKNILWHQTRLPLIARRHRIEVLHVPSYRRMLWPKPCALVATIHDLAPFHVPKKYDWKRMFYGRVVARQLARRQDEIIAISRNTAKDVHQFFGLNPDRVSVVHNGVEHGRFHPGARDTARLRAIEKYGLRQPFFLYIARLEHPGKNHVRLIAAFNQFKAASGSRWHLVLGGSDWQDAEVIHRAIRESPFATDIQTLGFVSNENLPDLYRAADAFVFPSLYEGFGMPPIEAMACGCPVISSTRGSLGEVIGDAAAIIDPENIDSMAGQMEAVAGDSDLRLRLQTVGLKQARQFDWKRTAEETLRVYERATRRLKSPRARSRRMPEPTPDERESARIAAVR